MKAIGIDLKQAREKKKKSVSQIAGETKISARYLLCLEEGRYGELPGGMYNRAFLRAYCDAIGIDAKPMLARYETEVSSANEKPPKHVRAVQVSLSPGPRVHPLLVWSLMLIISLSGLFFSRKWIAAVFSPYFSNQPIAAGHVQPSNEPAPQQKTPADVQNMGKPLTTDMIPVSSASSEMSLSYDPATGVAAPIQSIHLEFEVLQNCWVSVRKDGTRVLVKELKPGEAGALDATKDFFLILGNAGGVRFKINGKPLKLLGKPGQIVKVLIDENSLQNLLEKTTG